MALVEQSHATAAVARVAVSHGESVEACGVGERRFLTHHATFVLSVKYCGVGFKVTLCEVVVGGLVACKAAVHVDAVEQCQHVTSVRASVGAFCHPHLHVVVNLRDARRHVDVAECVVPRRAVVAACACIGDIHYAVAVCRQRCDAVRRLIASDVHHLLLHTVVAGEVFFRNDDTVRGASVDAYGAFSELPRPWQACILHTYCIRWRDETRTHRADSVAVKQRDVVGAVAAACHGAVLRSESADILHVDVVAPHDGVNHCAAAVVADTAAGVAHDVAADDFTGIVYIHTTCRTAGVVSHQTVFHPGVITADVCTTVIVAAVVLDDSVFHDGIVC